MMKKKGGKLVKDTIGQMLSCLHRDILTLIDLTAGEFRYRLECLRKDQRRVLLRQECDEVLQGTLSYLI